MVLCCFLVLFIRLVAFCVLLLWGGREKGRPFLTRDVLLLLLPCICMRILEMSNYQYAVGPSYVD